MAQHRCWRVEVEGFPPITTDELTIDEADLAERVSGVPYVLMNPISSVKVAKALLVILLKRSRVNAGKSVDEAEAEALEVAGGMPLRALHEAFTFVPGDRDRDQPLSSSSADPPSSAPTSVSG